MNTQKCINNLTVNSIQTLRNQIDTFDYGKWIFRGQSDASWPLETSINRFRHRLSKIKYGKKPLLGQEKIEWRKLMHSIEFELFNAYVQNNHPEDAFSVEKDLLNVLTKLQHFGCPTRLLDFTLVPYIALFFAAMENTGDFALYAVKSNDVEELKYCDKSVIDKFWGEKGAENPQVYLYKPRYTNERMKLQKGVFLFPSTTVYPFEKIVMSSRLSIIKIIIPACLRSDIIKMLNKNNIGPLSVYPEREGSIKTLAWLTEAKLYL